MVVQSKIIRFLHSYFHFQLKGIIFKFLKEKYQKMTLSELKKIFSEQLSKLYSSGENSEIFTIVAQKILDLDRFQLRVNGDQNISERKENQFQEILIALKTGKPFQQILGETEFYGLKFFVNEHVLIPRPETEELLELAMEKLRVSGFEVRDKGPLKILDIGTGSGIIPIVLKKHFPNAAIPAIDFSADALKMAKKNADFHEVEIEFIHQDYLNENLTEEYDVIISNPPYIGMEEEVEIADSVKEFEPKMALFSPTSNALIFYEKIAEDCKNHLAENGWVFLEINQKLGQETRELFVNVLSEVELLKDISGNERFVWGRK